MEADFTGSRYLVNKLLFVDDGIKIAAIYKKLMSDDLRNTGSRDDNRISIKQPHEVTYWTHEFNCTEEELAEAIREVGPMVQDVRSYLRSGR